MSDRLKTVLLFGAPGVGKGTQGKMLGALPGFVHSATGDVFRQVVKNSKLGKIFYEYSSRGELVPDDVTVRMWDEAIRARIAEGQYDPGSDLLILDGIPRTPGQVDLMKRHIDVLRVVHLTCDDIEEMVGRLRRRALKENRHDDADENVIRRRWDVYGRQTQPVLDHYPKEVIAPINAVGTPAQVLADILAILAPIQNEHFAKFKG